MMFFRFGLTTLGFKRKHEFGIASFPKFIQVDLLFITFVILSKQQNRSLSELMRKYAFSENDLDWHPQVRKARRMAEAKGRAQGEAIFAKEIDIKDRQIKSLDKQLRKSQQRTHELQQQIHGMQLVGFVSEQKYQDDGETPNVIIEASK